MKKFELNEKTKILGSSILPPEIYKAILDAEDIIKDAHKEAQKIIASAQAQKEQILEQGQKEAAESLQKVYDDMKAQFEESKSQVINKMYSDMDVFLKKFRTGIPFLVENILFRIIGEFDEEELIARCIAMGIEEMRDATEMIIRVNPQDHEFLQRMLAPWLRQSHDGFIRLETDNFVPGGGAIIITEIGTVEISLTKQIEAYIDALKEQFGTPVDVSFAGMQEEEFTGEDVLDDDIDRALDELEENDLADEGQEE